MSYLVKLRLLFFLGLVFGTSTVSALDKPEVKSNRYGVLVSNSPNMRSISKRLYGRVDEVSSALASAGVTLEEERLPSRVSSVRLGSPSYHAGLVEQDNVLSASIEDRKLNLLFERGGRRYGISLHTAPAVLKLAVPANDRLPLVVGVEKTRLLTEDEKIKEIAKYELVILIDVSGSMNLEVANEKESKWEWCTKFVSSFSEKVIPNLAGRSITTVPFNGTFSTKTACTPAQVVSFFKNTVPLGSTDLGSPLKDTLGRFVTSGQQRPLLIVVLTDGMPNSGPPVESVLIEFSKQMHSDRDVRVLILEIGENSLSNSFLMYLDDYLVSDGAKYDFVEVTKFDELRKTTLVDALQKAIAERPQSSVSRAIQIEVDQLKAEIKRQRILEGKSKIEAVPTTKNRN